MVSRELALPMVESSVPFAPNEDEFTLCDIASAPSHVVKPFRVDQAQAALECRLHSTYEIKDENGTLGGTMVVGRVHSFYLDEQVFDADHDATNGYAPIARLGKRNYAELGDRFAMKPKARS